MAKAISENEVLNAFSTLLPYLSYMFDDDVSFGITDTETYLKVSCSPNLDLRLKEGDKIPEGGAVLSAIKNDKVLTKDVPKEVYGIAFKSYAIPIHNENGKVAGCVVLGKSLSKRKEVTNLAQTLTSALDQISIAVNNLSSGVQEVVDMNSDILVKVQEADAGSKDTDDILKFIQGIAAQTNMLGLNAAIEASRAGDAGKGFKVVATEIRKLSTSTSESVKRVDSVLKHTGATIKSINEKISKSNGVFQDEAATLQQIAAAIEELNSTAHMLETLANQI
jgi:hypothetical protein